MTTEPTDPALPGSRAQRDYHTLDVDQVAAALGVVLDRGLDDGEAAGRLADVGPNRLDEAPPRSKLLVFVDQFRSLLIVVLAAAAAVAALIGHVTDALIVLFVLLLNAVLGYIQENRAASSMETLRRMLAWHTRVRRDGAVREIDTTDVVPGDVVLLDAGDKVPADGRLVSATNLAVDESTLTGESEPVDKSADAVSGPEAALGDRTSMVHMNTVVTRGRGEMVVTATGMDTEMGAIAGMLSSVEPESTPLQRQLDHLGRRLAAVAGIAVVVVMGLSLALGDTIGNAMIDAIALAIAAVPEGLPAVVTVTLAVGVSQMAKRRAILRRLASVETLGATTVICSDKTGTLTMNQMTAVHVWRNGLDVTVTGAGYSSAGELLAGGAPLESGTLDPVLVPLALCSEAVVRDGELVGEPTDGALVTLAAKGGVDVDAVRSEYRRIAEIPFESAAKYMATFTQDDGGAVLVAAKGAPDVLVERCDLEPPALQAALAHTEALAGDGLRVLAVATQSVDQATFDTALAAGDLGSLVRGLHLEALVGVVDPPRPEVRDAIRLCRSAGIDVKMITGDHALTAAAIAADLDIRGSVVTGAELDALDDAELEAAIPGIGVCARVRPQHKVRLVRALKDRGEVVAMTGDGVNDAPALKAADIGVAMGITGTEVTKEAADMVLADDDFATIVGAVKRGRTIYDNILTFVRFQLATNFGAIGTILLARLLRMPTPLEPIQILLVNLIMDGPPAIALGVDPPRPNAMSLPPRDPQAAILDAPRITRLLWVGFVMMVGTVSMFAWGRSDGNEEQGVTLAFATFVLFQVANALLSRTERRSVFGRHTLTNRYLWIALAAVIALLVVVVSVPALHGLFKTTSLSAPQWAAAVLTASTLVWLEELRKLWLRAVDAAATRKSASAADAVAEIDG
ncbi:MAG: HAD-IC family P-type ATPase [Acidimicrobiia bacterium]|nr:HAD-IC family P-type ATPase [Acidimicrobiia bacterium]